MLEIVQNCNQRIGETRRFNIEFCVIQVWWFILCVIGAAWIHDLGVTILLGISAAFAIGLAINYRRIGKRDISEDLVFRQQVLDEMRHVLEQTE